MANIHRKKLGSGRIVWEVTSGSGKNRYRRAFNTKAQALHELGQIDRQVRLHGTQPTPGSIDDRLEEYDRHLEIDRRHSTRRRYMRVLRTFRIFLRQFHPGTTLMDEVRPRQVEDYKMRRWNGEIIEQPTEEELAREDQLRRELIQNRAGDGYKDNARFGWLGRKKLSQKISQRSLNYELKVCFSFFEWCVRKNYLFDNPCRQVERIRVPKKRIARFIPIEDLKKFFGACRPREKRVFGAMLLSGMRRGEAENLEWADVRFDLDLIFITHKPHWQPKTEERMIHISPLLEAVLRVHYAARTSDRWLFANRRGNQDTHLLEKMKKVCRRAGIPEANLHQLRHCFATYLRKAGTGLADLKDPLGHEDVKTTMIYADVDQPNLRSAVNRLADILLPILSPEIVTRPENAGKEDDKLFNEKELKEEGEELAGRQGDLSEAFENLSACTSYDANHYSNRDCSLLSYSVFFVRLLALAGF